MKNNSSAGTQKPRCISERRSFLVRVGRSFVALPLATGLLPKRLAQASGDVDIVFVALYDTDLPWDGDPTQSLLQVTGPKVAQRLAAETRRNVRFVGAQKSPGLPPENARRLVILHAVGDKTRVWLTPNSVFKPFFPNRGDNDFLNADDIAKLFRRLRATEGVLLSCVSSDMAASAGKTLGITVSGSPRPFVSNNNGDLVDTGDGSGRGQGKVGKEVLLRTSGFSGGQRTLAQIITDFAG